MILFPNCKINIGLRVLEKRADGFHNLETIFYPIPYRDALEVIDGNNSKKEKVTIISEGIPVAGDSKDNLIAKAYHLLDQKFNLPPVTFCLLKNIPMGAGLGGGSSDAAFAINLLDQLFKLNITLNEKLEFASKLGSDCAFFIHNIACFGSGRGEILEPVNLNLTDFWIAIVKPEIHISTSEAFKNLRLENKHKTVLGNTLKEAIQVPIEGWKAFVKNDFESSLFPAYPQLKLIKENLYDFGAVYASMSGSGSSLYGLFKSKPALKSKFNEMSYYECKLS